jgi:hypothetical protein
LDLSSAILKKQFWKCNSEEASAVNAATPTMIADHD